MGAAEGASALIWIIGRKIKIKIEKKKTPKETIYQTLISSRF
jgi:hypothetical protein